MGRIHCVYFHLVVMQRETADYIPMELSGNGVTDRMLIKIV